MQIPTGNIVPLFSFFLENGVVQEQQMKDILNHIYSNGANSVFILGSTGEGLYFMDKPAEKTKLLNSIRDANNKWNKDILIGVYGETAEEVEKDAQFVLSHIKNPYFVIPPPVNKKLNFELQKEHYDGIFDRISQPIFLYNNPSSFGNTELEPELCAYLKKYPNFVGLKDSSESDDNKKEFLKHLDETCSISCGKEGSIGKFMQMIPVKQRALAGMVPSISNVVNSFSVLWKYALAGEDDKMIALQKEINEFRNKIYHSEISKGKAQRGCKIAMSYLATKYGNGKQFSKIVSPSLDKPIEPEIVARIEATTEWCVQNNHILLDALK